MAKRVAPMGADDAGGSPLPPRVRNLGAIRFPSSSRPPAMWAEVPGDITKEELSTLFGLEGQGHWKVKRPSVLISVTGGATSLKDNVKPKEELVIKRGLGQAVRQTKAWVVTGGTDAGVMADVGKIIMRDLTDLDVVCIGVVQKKLVLRHEELHEQPPKATYPYPSKETCPSLKEQFRLEQNHSHFLLVDGDAQAEVHVRSQLQNMLCRNREASTTLRRPPSDPVRQDVITCPMVLVVIGGGLGTLRTVERALEDGRPVVVLPDTNDAAADIKHVCFPDGYFPKDEKERSQTPFIEPPGLIDREPNYQQDAPELLRRIHELGIRDTGANKERAVEYFEVNSENDEKNDLAQVIQTSLLNDFDTSMDAIRVSGGGAPRPSPRPILGREGGGGRGAEGGGRGVEARVGVWLQSRAPRDAPASHGARRLSLAEKAP